MPTETQPLSNLVLLTALGMAAVGWPSSASSQVIDIDAGGAVTVYDTPAVYTSEGVRSIPRPKPGGATGSAPSNLTEIIRVTANRHGLDPRLLEAVAWTESRLRQSAVSPKGAVGVMQLMDDTARDLGVDRFDWDQNVEGGAAYLGQMLARYRGDVSLALAAYNAGPGAVDRYGGVPPFRETKAYVRAVLSQMNTAAPMTTGPSDPLLAALAAP